MSGAPRGRGGNQGYSNGWVGRGFHKDDGSGRGERGFNNTWTGGAFNTFQGGKGRGVGNSLSIRAMGSGTRKEESSSVPEQDARPENDWVKTNQHLIPKESKADRLAKTRQTETKREFYVDVARRGYMHRRPTQMKPRRGNKDAHPTPTHSRSRSPKEEREFLCSLPPLTPVQEAQVRSPSRNGLPATVTSSVRTPGRVACSTNPTERTFRRVSASSLPTPSTSMQSDDGNLYDPNKTEEEKEQGWQENRERNMGLLVPPWSGPSLGAEMRDIERS